MENRRLAAAAAARGGSDVAARTAADLNAGFGTVVGAGETGADAAGRGALEGWRSARWRVGRGGLRRRWGCWWGRGGARGRRGGVAEGWNEGWNEEEKGGMAEGWSEGEKEGSGRVVREWEGGVSDGGVCGGGGGSRLVRRVGGQGTGIFSIVTED